MVGRYVKIDNMSRSSLYVNHDCVVSMSSFTIVPADTLSMFHATA